MFLVRLAKPWVNKIDDDEIHWESNLLVIDVATENEVMVAVKSFAPPKDVKIAEDLVRCYGYKLGEYYVADLYEMPIGQKVVSLGDCRNITFPVWQTTIRF